MARLVHRRSGHVLADRLAIAKTLPERMRGLLGRSSLSAGEGMLIKECSSIHTFFMKFSLDLVFVDADYAVRKIVREVKPWRLAMAFGARHVVELPAGALNETPLAPGDALALEELP